MPAGWKQHPGSPRAERWEGGSGALLQVRQAAGPGSAGRGPAPAHQTRSSAFPRPTEFVLVVPETLLLHASDLEISLSPYGWNVASLNKIKVSP